MIRRSYIIFSALLPFVLFGELDHLIITEVVLQPSDGEYIRIHNPTQTAVDLSDYYITDATDTSAGMFYYNLPSESNYWSGGSSDFIARFPDGYALDVGETAVLSLRDSSRYFSQYGSHPDLTLTESMRDAVLGQSTLGNSVAPKLDNSSETLVLFHWNDTSSTVDDVDYLLWGDQTCAVDKTDVEGYEADSPVDQQSFMPIHADEEKLVRVSNEGNEIQSGGNGITGHDETSENLSETWVISPLASTKPEISAVTVSPESPFVGDAITFSTAVTDDEGITSVELVYIWNELQTVSALTSTSNDTFTTTLSGFDESGSLTWYIRAEDVSGLKDSTNVNALTIAIPPEEPEDLSIADLLADLSNYVGEIVEIDGVVTVSAGKLRTSFTEAFLQDESGKGIILYNSSLDTSFHRGDSVMVTAEVDEFDGRPELIYSDIQILMENVELPTVEISIAEFNTLEYSYTFVKLWGKITSRSNPSGTNTGANIDIQDETGEVTTMRIWNTTNVLYNEDFELINLELDSLLQVGNEIEVLGIGGDYNGASQVQPAYAEDISEKQEGEVGDYSITLEVSPFPFVPQFGEVINYTYSFPDDARIKLRVFDVSGRHITTLFDEFRSISFYKESEWDGRNELNEIVGPGVYLMYLEVTDRSSGNTSTAVAPVVIGARMQ